MLHATAYVPALVDEARVPDHLSLVNLGAWNDDPIVIQAIKEKIDALLHSETEFLKETRFLERPAVRVPHLRRRLLQRSIPEGTCCLDPREALE